MSISPVKLHRARLGRNIRILRMKRGLSLRTFGQMIDVDYAYLSNIENAKANATVDVLAKIAEGLEVDIRDFRQSTSVGMRACSSSRRGRVVQSRCQT